jgi:SAM-dependent methyltransferase
LPPAQSHQLSAWRERLRAHTYDLGPGRYYQPAYAHIAAEIGLTEGAFLDVGCGPGWLAVHVAAGRPEVDAVGIDLSEAALALAERNRGPRLNIILRKMRAEEIIFPEGTFRAAAAVQSAHHWADPAAVLRELHRVLAPRARLYIYEADAELREVPAGWVSRRGAWPPDAWLRWSWSRFGMGRERWEAFKQLVVQSPFGGGEDGRHGFYRRLVLQKAG